MLRCFGRFIATQYMLKFQRGLKNRMVLTTSNYAINALIFFFIMQTK